MKFFRRLKKEVWKVVRGIFILVLIVSVVVTLVTYGKRIKRPDTVSMIIDSDSGNGIDDLFAISLALIDPKIEVLGLSSAQFNAHPDNTNDSTVFESQRSNETILQVHDTLNTPHPVGSMRPLPLTDLSPDKTDATAFIIEQVQQLEYGEKLNVVTLGATTNLASAILLDTTIATKIRWYGTGLKYNDRDRIWNKNEFNVRNDLDAMDYLLNKADLETYIMTETTGSQYIFRQTETFDLLRNRGPKYQFLVDKWLEKAREQREMEMTAVSLIQAIMNPDMIVMKDVWTPPENTRRRITVYTSVSDEKMIREFRRLLRIDMGDISSDRK